MSKLLIKLTVVVFSIVAGANIAGAQFDGSPSAPQPFYQHSEFANWDIQSHARGQESWAENALNPMQADHGSDCAGNADNRLFPTHTVSSYADTVFICKDHLMTAIDGSGYAEVVITPNFYADWSTGPATFTFEVSSHRTSTRDWLEFDISPVETALVLQPAGPDLQCCHPLNNEVIRLQHTGAESKGDVPAQRFMLQDKNYDIIGLTELYVADSKSVRDTFTITLYPDNTLTFVKQTGEPNGAPLVMLNRAPTKANFKQGLLQLVHHSYTPEKGTCFQLTCPAFGDQSGTPGTWHWDNVDVTPGSAKKPLTIIHSSTRRLTDGGGSVHFKAPAPANSFLRFSAIGLVRVNGLPVLPQVLTLQNESMNMYSVPIPAGTQDVTINMSGDGLYNGPFQAKDFHIWAKSGSVIPPGSPPLPTSTPSNAAPTATSAAATSTPGAPSATKTPFATSTAKASAPAATSTPTSASGGSSGSPGGTKPGTGGGALPTSTSTATVTSGSSSGGGKPGSGQATPTLTSTPASTGGSNGGGGKPGSGGTLPGQATPTKTATPGSAGGSTGGGTKPGSGGAQGQATPTKTATISSGGSVGGGKPSTPGNSGSSGNSSQTPTPPKPTMTKPSNPGSAQPTSTSAAGTPTSTSGGGKPGGSNSGTPPSPTSVPTGTTGGSSPTGSQCQAPTITSSLDEDPKSGGRVRFSWSAVPGATEYTVQRRVLSYWVTIGTVPDTSFTSLELVLDSEWKVFVAAGPCTVPGPATTFNP